MWLGPHDGEVEAAICPASLFDNGHAAREVGRALLRLDRDVSCDDDHGCAPLHPVLSDDEGVVALDPAVRGEDEEVEPYCEHLAVLGDRLPVELDDVAESLGVVAPPEAEPLGADPVLVRARHASVYLLVSPCLEDRRQPYPRLRSDH